MGGIFSGRQQSQAEAASPKEAYSKSKITQGSMSIIELLKPECLKTKKTKRKRSKQQQSLNQPEKKITKARKLTLEEWLLNSPATKDNKPECFNGGELYVFKHFSRRVHPSLSSSSSTTSNRVAEMLHETEASTSKPRDSCNCSLDISANSCASSSKGQSGKLKKRVSFRLPEEADIVIFDSPEESLASDYQSL